MPKSQKAIDRHRFRDQWRQADQDEIKLCGLSDPNIKVIEKVPRSSLSHVQRQGAMRSVFVRKVKRGQQDSALFKTRMTAQGSVGENDPSIPSSDRSSPAAGSMYLLFFISLVVTFRLMEDQIDFDSAFGQAGLLPESRRAYVWPQKGSADDAAGLMYMVIGNMYGRVDAPKRWYDRISAFLFKKGFLRTRLTETMCFFLLRIASSS